MEINGEDFGSMTPERQTEVLFKNMCGVEVAVKDLTEKVDLLLRSPWRMAIPPVSWKYLGMFLIAMALIIKGDVATAFRVLGALFGVM